MKQFAKELRIDFVGGAVAHRLQFGGGRGQSLAKAMGLRGGKTPMIIDATAGLGRDAFLLASLGAQVTLIERSERMHSLLAQGMDRAAREGGELREIIGRMSLLKGDAKDTFSKQALFMQGWEELYPGMIEWVSGSKGGRIDVIDVATRSLHTESGDTHKGDVVNFIPPQKAGVIAQHAGLTNNDGWCPVNQRTFESKVHNDIHVIGDASIAGSMPKSGFAANSQGKVCAAAIVTFLRGVPMPEPSYVNTCYSLVSPDYGISVAAVYRYSEDKGIYKTGGGVSPLIADEKYRLWEARYAEGWYDSITMDVFG